MRDWFESLGEYRQLQLIQTIVATALTIIYEQFIGEPVAANEAFRKEFHQMKMLLSQAQPFGDAFQENEHALLQVKWI